MKNLLPRNQILTPMPSAFNARKMQSFCTTAITLFLLFFSSGAIGQINVTVNSGNSPYNISGGGPYVLSSLIVEDGGTVNISGCTINVNQSLGSPEIQVNAGGILTLSSCTLKVNTGSTFWYGIGGAGDNAQDQYTNYPVDPSYSYSGSSSVLNKGSGKQSYIEISNCVISDMSNGVQAQTGCILYAYNTKFNDNLISIDINSYVNPNTGSQANGEYYNACTISDCSFEWLASPTVAGPFGLPNWDGYQFVKLADVNGVHIQGCHFKNIANNNATTLSCEDRGTAIYSYEASYSVHKSGTASQNGAGCTIYNGNVTSFEGTSYGVYATGVTPDFTVGINLCTFEKHYKAINIFSGSKHTISQNTCTSANSSKYPPSVIAVPPTGCASDITFITLDNSENCIVYFNTLTYTKIAAPTTSSITGAKLIECSSLGATSSTTIYKNVLSTPGGSSAGYLKNLYGMYFSGHCEGTSAKCNTFTDMKEDFYLDNSSYDMDFGTSTKAAGNVFSANAVKHIDNQGGGNTVNYYYYNSGLQIPAYPSKTVGIPAPTSSPLEGCDPYTCTVWPVGINEPLNNKNAIMVYPNPANTILNLDFANEYSKGFSIYDQTGRIVYTLSNNNTTQQIDISNWPVGIYFVQLYGSEAGIKFIVAR